jgi:predicted metal-dependent hydrolase
VSDLLNSGIFFFNSGRYFDAHEVWEDLWRGSGGPLRLYYQGLIQAAVGLHHLGQGNLNGARAQLGKAIEKLEQYPPAFCRIDNEGLVAELRVTLQDLTARAIAIRRVPDAK